MQVGFISLTVAILVILEAVIYRFFGRKKITYSREYEPQTAFEGEKIVMTEKIANAKLLPMPWVRVESMLSPHLHYLAYEKDGETGKKKQVYGEHNSVFSIGPYSTVIRKYTMLCEKRGYYALRAVNLTCQDIFGIGEPQSAEAEINAAVTVYPRIADFTELGDISKSMMGDVVVRRWIAEDPFMIRGTRDYTTSDPQSKINWKASARTGSFVVNENDPTADIKLYILFNVQADRWFRTDVDPDCIEAGVSKAAALLQFAAEHGITAAFASNSVDSPLVENRTGFGNGSGHLGELFRQLACLSRESKVNFGRFLTEETGRGLTDCGILVMTAFWDDEIAEGVENLRQEGNLVEVMMLDRTPGTFASEKEA